MQISPKRFLLGLVSVLFIFLLSGFILFSVMLNSALDDSALIESLEKGNFFSAARNELLNTLSQQDLPKERREQISREFTSEHAKAFFSSLISQSFSYVRGETDTLPEPEIPAFGEMEGPVKVELKRLFDLSMLTQLRVLVGQAKTIYFAMVGLLTVFVVILLIFTKGVYRKLRLLGFDLILASVLCFSVSLIVFSAAGNFIEGQITSSAIPVSVQQSLVISVNSFLSTLQFRVIAYSLLVFGLGLVIWLVGTMLPKFKTKHAVSKPTKQLSVKKLALKPVSVQQKGTKPKPKQEQSKKPHLTLKLSSKKPASKQPHKQSSKSEEVKAPWEE
jgi:uncharacterized membrane protein YciS (DUF1049 family)